MSIWSNIVSGITGGVSRGIEKRIIGKSGRTSFEVPTPLGQSKFFPAAAGTIGRVLTGRVATGIGIGAAGATLFGGGGNGGACPSGWHLNKQDGVGGAAGTYCVRNRRMNFGNARAARRGVRRLKGAQKLLRDIEKMMPRPRARRQQHATPSPIVHTR